MSREERQVALLKVLAAAAWADGRVEADEVDHIKEIARRYDLEPVALREVEELLETPIPIDRCEQLTRSLLDQLDSDAERREVIGEIERLFHSDAVLDPREKALLDDIRGALASQSAVEGFLGRITDVFRSTFSSAGGRGAGSLGVHLTNAVLTRLDTLSDGKWREAMAEEDLNRVCLFAAALGKVADTEDGKSTEEMDLIAGIVSRRFGVEPPLLDWLLDAVRLAASADMDRQKLLSEYNRITDMKGRLALLDAAFSVAAADGTVGDAELSELRLMSNYLWLDPRDFHGVRARWTKSG